MAFFRSSIRKKSREDISQQNLDLVQVGWNNLKSSPKMVVYSWFYQGFESVKNKKPPTRTGNTRENLGNRKKSTNPRRLLPSLKLTAKAPENACLEYDRFLLRWPIFRCELLVAGRVDPNFFANDNITTTFCLKKKTPWHGSHESSWLVQVPGSLERLTFCSYVTG